VDFVFDYLDQYDFVASHSDIHDIRRFVWRDSIYGAGALTREQIRYSANTGFLASRTDALDLGRVEAGLADALALAEHMETRRCGSAGRRACSPRPTWGPSSPNAR